MTRTAPPVFSCATCDSAIVPDDSEWRHDDYQWTGSRYRALDNVPVEMRAFLEDRAWLNPEALQRYHLPTNDGDYHCPLCITHCDECDAPLHSDAGLYEGGGIDVGNDYHRATMVCCDCYESHYTYCELCESYHDNRDSDCDAYFHCDACDSEYLKSEHKRYASYLSATCSDQCDYCDRCDDCCDCDD